MVNFAQALAAQKAFIETRIAFFATESPNEDISYLWERWGQLQAASGSTATTGAGSTALQTLYRPNSAIAPTDPIFAGWLSGGKLYSDIEQQSEVDLQTVTVLGDRTIDRIPWQLNTPETFIPAVELSYATALSSFHSVSGHPGQGEVLPLRFLVSGSETTPTARSQFARYDTAAEQDFLGDSDQEQITIEVEGSLTWASLERADQSGSATATASLTGELIIVREV